ncbi:hypothetical protein GJ496_005134 [Pomphorhynchus laevis]|nr:hypothetical protein GJ496_005134 [Pomphorhynchus laevis]
MQSLEFSSNMIDKIINEVNWKPYSISLCNQDLHIKGVQLNHSSRHSKARFTVARGSSHEKDALKLAVLFSKLVMQNTGSRKISHIRKALERRLYMWQQNKAVELFDEARILQVNLEKQIGTPRSEDRNKRFIRLIKSGPVKSAVSILNDDRSLGTVDALSEIDGVTVDRDPREVAPRIS